MSINLGQFGIDKLTIAERCELIELLWDSLPPDTPLALPAWHIEELERRIVAAEAAEASRLRLPGRLAN